jgi:penicillin-binding protein A
MRSRWIYAAVPLGALGLFLALRHPNAGGEAGKVEEIPLSKRIFRPSVESDPAYLPKLGGVDLTKLKSEGNAIVTELPDKTQVKLTLDPHLQRTASALLTAYAIPESSIVMMDPATGHVLAYASHIEGKPNRDLNVEATAPAASVFKVVTGTALVDVAQLTPETNQCYTGGEQRINAADLENDPAKDKYCATLAGAMGRSLNTVFARLALKHLPREKLAETAKSFYFGRELPFDVPVQPSTITLPEDSLGYARTAAGFWNTTLSPLHAAWLSATFARGGEPVRPVIVSEIVRADQKKIYAVGEPVALPRIMSEKTADAVTTMMEYTVSDGTSFRAFHDRDKTPFLPGITVAGKTGTLTDAQNKRFYTWFTGFAPSKPAPGAHAVAISVLVANGPIWKVKANVIAREMLRAFFAQEGVKGVSKPTISALDVKATEDAMADAKAGTPTPATSSAVVDPAGGLTDPHNRQANLRRRTIRR